MLMEQGLIREADNRSDSWKLPVFMELERYSPFSQDFNTRLHPELDESSSYTSIYTLFTRSSLILFPTATTFYTLFFLSVHCPQTSADLKACWSFHTTRIHLQITITGRLQCPRSLRHDAELCLGLTTLHLYQFTDIRTFFLNPSTCFSGFWYKTHPLAYTSQFTVRNPAISLDYNLCICCSAVQ